MDSATKKVLTQTPAQTFPHACAHEISTIFMGRIYFNYKTCGHNVDLSNSLPLGIHFSRKTMPLLWNKVFSSSLLNEHTGTQLYTHWLLTDGAIVINAGEQQ